MRVFKATTIRAFEKSHPDSVPGLERWLAVVRAAEWRNIADVRRVFRTVDEVLVQSKRRVAVFNIAGNRFRLIAAIHYNLGKVFVLRFMTHAEYDKNRWKGEL